MSVFSGRGGQGRGGPAARGALEDEVLACLAAAGRSLTVAQVQAALPRHLAYTTVMTTLARLHDKGALERTRHGRSWAYMLRAEPEQTRASVVARSMRKLLDAEDDRAFILARFVADLEPSDEQVLRELLNRPPDDRSAG